jgi:hypothetical protein
MLRTCYNIKWLRCMIAEKLKNFTDKLNAASIIG